MTREDAPCPKPGSLRQSWSPTWSATAGSPERTRIDLVAAAGAAQRSDRPRHRRASRAHRQAHRATAVVIEFRSVVDAVRCAIEVQNGMIERNAGLPPERRIEFRVGIHLGDVVEESRRRPDGRRRQYRRAAAKAVAKPGAICLSEDAYRQVKGRLDRRSAISARPSSRTSPSRFGSTRWTSESALRRNP